MSARRIRSSVATTLIALAGALLVACGDGSNDSKLLTPSSASELRSTLAQVEQMVESGDCTGAQEQVSLLEQQVDSLDRVEADLQDALITGTSRLQQLVVESCQAPAAETGVTGTTGPTDTGGVTAPEEQETDEDQGKKEKRPKRGKSGDEGRGGGQQDEGGADSGGSGGAGSTGSGGFGP